MNIESTSIMKLSLKLILHFDLEKNLNNKFKFSS